MTYYNTTHVTGRALASYQRHTETQEAAVARFFERHSNKLWSPEDVHRLVMPKAPRHSVARAMANLKRQGILEKTSEQCPGKFARPIYLWRLKPRAGEAQQEELFG